MLTTQHKTLLHNLIKNKDVEGIHELMKQFSVADQKRLKLILVETLGNRKKTSCEDSLQIYARLIPLDLNLYYKSFLLAAPAYKKEEEFWNNLEILKPLGLFLSTNKAYYRQNLISIWIKGISHHHSVKDIFQVMVVQNPIVQLNYLIESDSLYGYYEFMLYAIKNDVEVKNISKLIRKLLLPDPKTTLPQNIREDTANFLTHHFNIHDLQYNWHRELDVTTFAFAEKSFESFVKVVIPASRIQHYLDTL